MPGSTKASTTRRCKPGGSSQNGLDADYLGELQGDKAPGIRPYGRIPGAALRDARRWPPDASPLGDCHGPFQNGGRPVVARGRAQHAPTGRRAVQGGVGRPVVARGRAKHAPTGPRAVQGRRRGDLWSPTGVQSTPVRDAGQFRGDVGQPVVARGRAQHAPTRRGAVQGRRRGDLWWPTGVQSTPLQDAGQFRGDVGATCGRPRACAARPYKTRGSSGET